MLKIKDFKKMNLMNKLRHLYKDGCYIAVRSVLNNEILLFYYNGYFIEVWKEINFGHIYSIDISPKKRIKRIYQNMIDYNRITIDFKVKY